MPIAVKNEALAKKDKKPLYKFSFQKESKTDWVYVEEKKSDVSIGIPADNFVSASSTEEPTLVIASPAYDIDEEYRSASKSVFYLLFFTSYNYRLKKPLLMVMEQGINPNVLLVGNEKLNKYGIGFSKEEALKEFEDFIIADYRNLKNSSPEQLSEDAKELLSLYDSYIEL